MRRVGWLLLSILALSVALPIDAEARRKCTGSKSCRACKNCKYCKHCNSGGSCGVCRK